MLKKDILEFVSDMCQKNDAIKAVVRDLRNTEPNVEPWMMRELGKYLADIQSKYNLNDKFKADIYAACSRAFFLGFLSSRIDAENTLKATLGIDYDPLQPHRPEKTVYNLWIDGMLTAEYYTEDPEKFDESHPYRKAYANFKSRKDAAESEPAKIVKKLKDNRPKTKTKAEKPKDPSYVENETDSNRLSTADKGRWDISGEDLQT